MPIRLLRQPDRWVQAKPIHIETMQRLRRGYNNTSSAASGFSVAFLRRYRYIFCVSPTDGFRLNRYTRNRQACSLQWCVLKLSTALTLREATTVSSAPSTPGNQRYAYQCKLNAPLKKREATTVSSAPSTPGYRNMRIRRCGNAPLKRRYG